MFGSWPGGIATGVLQRGPNSIPLSGQIRRDSMHLLTRRRDAVMLCGIVLGARMGGRQEVFPAERLRTMLTLEWEEVDEVARRVGALLPDVKQLGVALGSCRHSGEVGICAEKDMVGIRDGLCDDRAYMASSRDARPPSGTRTRKLRRPRWLLCKKRPQARTFPECLDAESATLDCLSRQSTA